jgi:hypothetical protein
VDGRGGKERKKKGRDKRGPTRGVWRSELNIHG